MSEDFGTVLDAKWAGDPESNAHLHLTWELVRYAKLEETNRIVKCNIDHNWKLSILNAACEPLFWFYLKNEHHRAYLEFKKRSGAANDMFDFASGTWSRA